MEDILNKIGPNENLFMEVIKTNEDPDFPTSFAVGQKFQIEPSGLRSSKRYCADGSVIFGRAAPENRTSVDLFFNSQDSRISRYHFQVLTKQKAYYIVDAGKRIGTAIKIKAEKPLKLEKNMILDIGFGNKILVEECQSKENFASSQEKYFILRSNTEYLNLQRTVTNTGLDTSKLSVFKRMNIKKDNQQNEAQMNRLVLKFLSGEKEGERQYLTATQSKHFFDIGRYDSNKPKNDIEFLDRSISCSHAVHVQDVGWVLQDLHSSNGTWVMIIDYNRMQHFNSSDAVQVEDGMVVAVAETQFLCRLVQR